MRHVWLFLIVLGLSWSSTAVTLAAARPSRATALPAAVTPTTMVPDGVTDFAVLPPAVTWHTGVPPCFGLPTYLEGLSVMSIYGGVARPLYRQTQGCGAGQVLSNIVADVSHVYWISPAGLVRLPAAASPGTPPELLTSEVVVPGELADGGDRVYVLSGTTDTRMGYVLKSDGDYVPLQALGGQALNLSFDGEYLYFLVGGSLVRALPGGSSSTIAGGVSGYYAEGRKTLCTQVSCFVTSNVFIGQGRNVVRFSNINSATTPVYTSSDSTAVIVGLISDDNKIYLNERRTGSCQPLCTYTYNLIRSARSAPPGGDDGPIYATGNLIGRLALVDEQLYWREHTTPSDGRLLRLATSTEPLSLNLHVSNVVVTQGIQHLSNNVPLIRDRRTFVRVFALSNGLDAAGVTAFLFGSWDGGAEQGPLVPINPAGTRLTVTSSYQQSDINQAFLFELPWEWTHHSNLKLRVELNPYRLPLETSHVDNNYTAGPFSLQSSPRLAVQFVSFGFSLNNTTYFPNLINDVFGNYSWIRRVYPLASTPGGMSDPTAGFRPNHWFVFDAGLGARVNRSAPECNRPPYLILNPDSSIKIDDRQYCASAYTNARLAELRLDNQLEAQLFMYGMIRDLGGNNFPRGQAGGGRVSSGPAAPGWVGFYAGHEIAHTLGRGHPLTGNGQCDLVGGDPFPSYADAKIGPTNDVVEGFDVGDAAFGIPFRVLKASDFTDLMAYCQPQWISDQNYKNLLTAQGTNAAPAQQTTAAPVQGDWLTMSGLIDPETNSATFVRLRRLPGPGNVPPATPGLYALHLRDAGGSLLVAYPLPLSEPLDGPGWLTFDHRVPFVDGTRLVQLVTAAGGQVLAARSVSANPPVIANVTVAGQSGAGNTLLVSWDAVDPDGDALQFDIYYGTGAGSKYRPVQFDVSGSSTVIDRSDLAGSSAAQFTVIASDGVQAAQASSPPFALATRPPAVRILSPADGAHAAYGQLINMSGEAWDAQDGTVAASGLVWRYAGQAIGSGPLLSLSDLPPGENEITLEATNSAGQTAVASVTVFVTEDLMLPGPYLSAGPDSVSWQVEKGETALQTARVTLRNVGGGSLAWQATENTDWLTVGPAEGGDRGELRLTADPVGLSAGMAHEALVELSVFDGDGRSIQTMAIPVRLYVGNLRAPWSPAAERAFRVFLPGIRR